MLELVFEFCVRVCIVLDFRAGVKVFGLVYSDFGKVVLELSIIEIFFDVGLFFRVG